MLEKAIVNLLVGELRSEGFLVRTEVPLHRGFVADILAEKNGERHLIEVRASSKDVIPDFIKSRWLTRLPNMSTVSLALPSEAISDDILRVAQMVSFGIYSVSRTHIKLPAPMLEGNNGKQIRETVLGLSQTEARRLGISKSTFHSLRRRANQKKAFRIYVRVTNKLLEMPIRQQRWE